jgi:transformation/transcription domain-associated protein
MLLQALFYQLRTSKEDFILNQRQMAHAQAKRMQEMERLKRQKAAQDQAAGVAPAAGRAPAEDDSMSERPAKQNSEASAVKTEQVEVKAEPANPQEETSRGPDSSANNQKVGEAAEAAGQDAVPGQAEGSAQGTPATGNAEPKPAEQPPSQPNSAQPNFQTPRQPQEYVDDTLNILKTAFPLLALSMEKMVDHINVRSRAPPEEDIYRFFSALLTDAISVCQSGSPENMR